MHKYAPKYRPPGFATVPDGWELLETGRNGSDHFPLRSDLPRGIHAFGLIGYPQPLTREQVESYELVPV